MNKIDKNILKYTKYLNQIHKNDIFALKTIFHISEKGGTNMKKMWKQMAMAYCCLCYSSHSDSGGAVSV